MKQNTTYPNDWGVLHLIAMAAWWKTARAQTVLQLRRRLEKLHCSNKLCPNCKGNHSELYKECPHCKKQSQIIKINTTFNISYAEACKKFKKYCNICDSWFDLSSGISPSGGCKWRKPFRAKVCTRSKPARLPVKHLLCGVPVLQEALISL